MIMVEVDDLMLAGSSLVLQQLRAELTSRFQFGNWQHLEADYAGRHVRVLPDRVEVDQEKYIIEDVNAIKLAAMQQEGGQAVAAHPC